MHASLKGALVARFRRQGGNDIRQLRYGHSTGATGTLRSCRRLAASFEVTGSEGMGGDIAFSFIGLLLQAGDAGKPS